MKDEQIIEYSSWLYTTGSLVIGAILGIIANKATSAKANSKWKFTYYIISALSEIVPIYIIISLGLNKVFDSLYIIVGCCACIISPAILYLIARKHLIKDDIYDTAQLDPIVNEFTSNADKTNIRLFGGDLNFFGRGPVEMRDNAQYKCLLNEEFRSIHVLCECPCDNQTRIRYTQILKDFSERIQLKFYHPDNADLKIRGRIKTLNNVVHLLIYTKVGPRKYSAIETDKANSHGALYDGIWDLVWDLASPLKEEDLVIR
jgi:hypothetical protein